MNFALVIPTRKDRPEFIKQCEYLISKQTVQPTEVFWVDYPPKTNKKDITERYKLGVEQATKRGHEFVVFWEDDDWYDKNYLKWIIGEWQKKGKPNFFGVGETYYYHLGVEKVHHMQHSGRTSAFCTLVKLPFRCSWPADNYPFLDLHIHKNASVVSIPFPKDKIYAIGVKHGIGLSGGGGHRSNFRHYKKVVGDWFYNIIGEDSKFYKDMKSKINKIINEVHKQNNNVKIQKRKITPINSNPQLQRRSTKIRKIRPR